MPLVKLMPQRRNLDGNALLTQPFTQLLQRQIRLRIDPFTQRRFPRCKARGAMPANLKTMAQPFALEALLDLIHPLTAHLKTLRNSNGAIPAIQRP